MESTLPPDWLCCPLTGKSLRPAEPDLIAELEAARQEGRLRFVTPPAVLQLDLSRPLEGGLLREDGAVLYLIEAGLPVLLPDHAVAVG